MTPLPPKIELALGYLGGTEANRIREYIADLQWNAEVALTERDDAKALLRTRLEEFNRKAQQVEKLEQEVQTLRQSRDHLSNLADLRYRELNETLYRK